MYSFKAIPAMLLLLILSGIAPYCSAQLTVTPGSTAAMLANALAGPGVTIINPGLVCPTNGRGTFTVTPGTVVGTGPATWGIGNGIILSTGQASSAAGPEATLASTNMSAPGDAALNGLAGATTYDACIFEFDLIPSGDTVTFNYIFGSEEYNHSTCGPFNDAFAFFISGPGIIGTQNMALVPGTTIPVTVNSINSGVPGAGYTLANCTSMGPGSPFVSLFNDNTGGPNFTMQGFTKVLTAKHTVTPCDTFHLKMTVADAGNRLYDSEVFLEAGSLTSNTYHFSTSDSIGATINGMQHTIVKGCNKATIKLLADHTSPTPETIGLYFGGTAVVGTDLDTISTNIVLPAGSNYTTFDVQAIPTPVAGPKTLVIYIRSACGFFDSVLINVLDSPVVNILTPDTIVCPGSVFTIRTSAPAGVTYSWSPAAGLSSTTVAQPVCTPPGSTTYVLSATYPNIGCPVVTRSINIRVGSLSLAIAQGDSVFCTGTYYTFYGSGIPASDMMWTFGPGDTIKGANPVIHAWSNPGIYNVMLDLNFAGCSIPTSKTVTVYANPDIYLGPDTSICPGHGTILLQNRNGILPPGTLWSWSTGNTTPSLGVAEPGMYAATVTLNGCISSDSVVIANDCYINIPNAFTPNGDGVNDYFFPRSLLTRGLTTFHMTIYNRWGQLIFETKSLDGSGWDGRFNDMMQPQGVFVYVIDATFKDGEEIHKQGNVTLLK